VEQDESWVWTLHDKLVPCAVVYCQHLSRSAMTRLQCCADPMQTQQAQASTRETQPACVKGTPYRQAPCALA
jgi:hypothetical protein